MEYSKLDNRKLDNSYNINYGINLLRLLLTFAVILNHFWKINDPGLLKPLYLFRSCAVPTFMLLSFLLTEKVLFNSLADKLKIRIRRLAWPFIVWGGRELVYSYSRRENPKKRYN